MRPGSQCSLIVEVLADGQWHSTAEIHRRAGFSRLNSRVSELRKLYGLNVESRQLPGMKGPEAHEYRLLGEAGGTDGNPSGRSVEPDATRTQATRLVEQPLSPPGCSPARDDATAAARPRAGQLSLLEAA